MDALVVSTIFSRDTDQELDYAPVGRRGRPSVAKDAMRMVVPVLIAAYAVLVSWEFNRGEDLFWRVLFAAVAGSFGTTYLLYVLIFRHKSA